MGINVSAASALATASASCAPQLGLSEGRRMDAGADLNDAPSRVRRVTERDQALVQLQEDLKQWKHLIPCWAM